MQAVLLRIRPLARPVLLCAALVLLLSACNLQLRVTIDVQEDGSGTVTAGVGLDLAAQAVPAFGDLDGLLVVDDLVAAGWTVGGVEQGADGREWFEASKPFAGPDELQSVLDELTGPDGAFTGWTIERDASAVRTQYRVVGDVDLTAGLEAFTDAELSSLLAEPPLGVSLESLAADLGRPVDELVQVEVVVQLPGADAQTTEIALGDQARVSASAADENRTAQLLVWVRWALIALLGLAVVLAAINYVLDRRYERAEPRRRPGRMADRVPGAVPGQGGGRAAAAPRRARSLQLLILDLHTVLFRSSGEAEDLLIPFIREKGGTAPDPDIVDLHHEATLGRLTSAEFWSQAGVDGDPAALDADYISRFRLQSGAREFLREMHRRGMPIAVITNDLAEWSYGLRDLHGMQGMMPWIVSAEIGVRKPDTAAFEAARRLTGLPYASCLLIDGRLEVLDEAKALGMMTAWFTRTAPDDRTSGHPVVARFGDFFRRRRAAAS